eukprot:scaffold736_cov254-Pinguiococcus_pyrenoidosus.AAC.43
MITTAVHQNEVKEMKARAEQNQREMSVKVRAAPARFSQLAKGEGQGNPKSCEVLTNGESP